MSSIADNVGTVTRRIQKATMDAGRPDSSVHLLAVSKTRPPQDLRTAYQAGLRAFGENYLQEALDKIESLSDLTDIEWHFIGPIQSNKTRQIAGAFDWVHSVDRLKIARRLSEQRPDGRPPLNLCLQVNVNNEDSKSGCTLDELPALAAEVLPLPGVRLRGLMAIPDPQQSESALRNSFQRLAKALQQIREAETTPQDRIDLLDTLSMGMSADLEIAVQEGATWVRIGTALFGARS